MADEISIVVNAVDNFSGVLGNFGNIMTGLRNTLDMVSGAIQGVADFTGQFVDAAAASETSITKLDTVFSSMNASSWITLQQLDDLSISMMNLTGNSDEAEKAAETMLLRFENLNGDAFPQALQLTNDLSASLGIDLVSAARMVGMALDDPTQGIGRLNTQFRIFDDSQMEVIKHMAETGDIAGAQALIIQGLTDKFGGAAEAIGNTFTGKLDIARETLDNFKEAIGAPFIEILKVFFDQFINFGNSTTIQTIESFFTRFAQLIADGNPIIASLGATFMNFESVNPIFAELGNWLLLLQGYLNSGSNPFDAIRKSIDDLLFAHPDGPLAPILKSIQEFINTGQTEGWGAAIGNLFTDIGDALDLKGKIQNLVNSLANIIGITDWAPVTNALTQILSSALTNVFNGLSDIVTKVDWEPLGDALVTALQEMFAGAVNQISFDNVKNIIKNSIHDAFVNADWGLIGENIITGIGMGISSSMFMLLQTIGNTVNNVIDYFKNLLGISSPSTVFYNFAVNMIQGLIDGWNDTVGSFINAVGTTIEDIGNLFGIDLSSILGQSASGLGTASGGTAGGSAGGGAGTGTSSSTTGQTVNNYFYGPVYFNQGTDNTDYDCISPNPLMTSGSGTPVFTPI